MLNRRYLLLGATALSLTAACASAPSATTTPPPPRYSAAAFFQTTSYGQAAPSGYAFSPDGRTILMSNDSSGIFNAYVLSIEGGAAVPLTSSTTNATFALSYFPRDERVLVSADERAATS